MDLRREVDDVEVEASLAHLREIAVPSLRKLGGETGESTDIRAPLVAARRHLGDDCGDAGIERRRHERLLPALTGARHHNRPTVPIVARGEILDRAMARQVHAQEIAGLAILIADAVIPAKRALVQIGVIGGGLGDGDVVSLDVERQPAIGGAPLHPVFFEPVNARPLEYDYCGELGAGGRSCELAANVRAVDVVHRHQRVLDATPSGRAGRDDRVHRHRRQLRQFIHPKRVKVRRRRRSRRDLLGRNQCAAVTRHRGTTRVGTLYLEQHPARCRAGHRRDRRLAIRQRERRPTGHVEATRLHLIFGTAHRRRTGHGHLPTDRLAGNVNRRSPLGRHGEGLCSYPRRARAKNGRQQPRNETAATGRGQDTTKERHEGMGFPKRAQKRVPAPMRRRILPPGALSRSGGAT
ncbi:MAG: hypothetical protein BWX86_01691 [Verrucomicrobia bacterium ADurb.Bin122]|nr:MAG: hypothetical protein BWX86_01691 [Verrucomicrobia bacterium ADurb.Bin122]